MWGKIKIPKTVESEEISTKLVEWGFPVLWMEEGDDEIVVAFDQVEEVSQEVDWESQSAIHSPYFVNGYIEYQGLKFKAGHGFGDLSHTTTNLILTLIKDISDSVFDLGCGNGILACIAKSQGAKEVYAWDIDQEALTLAEENSRLNQLDIIFKPVTQVDTLLINMIMSEQKEALMGVQANTIIASGILKEEKETYLQFMKDYHLVEEREENGWLALKLSRLK